MKNTVVVFTKNNARILRNPSDIEKYLTMSNAIVNPDLSKVVGIPTHLWEKNGNEITALQGVSREARLIDVEKNGVNNTIECVTEKDLRPKRYKVFIRSKYIQILLQIIIASLLGLIIFKKGV